MDWPGSELGTDIAATLGFLPRQGEIFIDLISLGWLKAQNYLQTLILLSSCITIHLPTAPTEIPIESPMQDQQQVQPQPTQDVQKTDEEQPEEATNTPNAMEELIMTTAPESARIVMDQCAYITGMSMRMDGQTDITFDYVDWLSGEEAQERYVQDHPGSTDEDIEAAGIYEIGYIRNVNDKQHTFHTGSDTKYYFPDQMDISTIVEVSYDEFRDRMFPAVEIGENAYLTFVQIDLDGDTLTRVEWLYLP